MERTETKGLMMRQRVFLIPSDHVGWIAIRAELQRIERATIVGEAISAQQAIADIAMLRPDVVIAAEIVEDMPIRLLLTKLRRTSCPQTRLIVFAPHLDPDTVLPFAEIGVAGYIFWGSLSCNGLTGCLVALLECRVQISSEEAVQVLTQAISGEQHTMSDAEVVSHRLDAPTRETLTPQQRAVLCLVENGLSNRVIADRLCISPKTVKKHLEDIYERLRVHNRISAVQKASNLGLL